jgi:segregation and condensation protein A
MEAIRMLMVRRGNLQKDLAQIGEEAGEGTEIQAITLFKLMKTFEKLMLRIQQRQNRPVHTVVKYNYTMEESRDHMFSMVRREKTVSFGKIFEICHDRIHAIFLFLSMLELVQMKYMHIMIGEGRNNFIIEFNADRGEEEEDYQFFKEPAGLSPDLSGELFDPSDDSSGLSDSSGPGHTIHPIDPAGLIDPSDPFHPN